MNMHLIYWKLGTLPCRNRVKWSNSPRFNYLHTGWSKPYRLQLNLHSWRRSDRSSIYKCLPYTGEIWGQHRPRFSSLCAFRNCVSTNGDLLWMWTIIHDDVIKWKHFPRNWPFVRGIHRSRWIPHTKASDAELWCYLWSASE